jgi:hypothetical protein
MKNNYFEASTLARSSLTNHTASRAINVRTSAQETVFGHAFSNLAFTCSIEPNPRRLRFGSASLSATLFFVEFNRTDPSQPYI